MYGTHRASCAVHYPDMQIHKHIQGDSAARDPKLLSIKNYIIEIMT